MSVAAFELTPANDASAPPAERDEVRLLVAQRGRPLLHDMFRGLPGHLRAGDLLVVNTSATMPAALSAGEVDVHLSTPLPEGSPSGAADRWVVELRRCGARYRGGRAGDRLPLPGGGSAELLAPLALIQLARARIVVNVTSDAAAEPYEGWGGYGSSKAALEQLTAILAAEQPERRIYAIDPGDMNTRMHQEAFPGEDISDRPPPEDSVPGVLALIDGDLPSGRYAAHDLVAVN